METKQVNMENMLDRIQSKWTNLSSTNKLSIITATIASLIISRSLYKRVSTPHNPKSDRKTIPDGPSGIPIFGSFFEIRRDSLKFYASLPLFYGPLSCHKFGSTNIISINDPIIARNVYINNNKSVINRYVTGVKHPVYHGFSLQNGKPWLQRRKIIQSQLITITNTTFIDNVARPILSKYIFAEFDKSKFIHTRQLFRNLTFCIIYCAIFGMSEHKQFEFNGDVYNKYNQYIKDIFESQPLSTEMTLLFGEKSFISTLIWNCSKSKAKFMKTIQKMCDMTLSKYLQIKAAKSHEIAMNKASFCEYICKYQQNQDENDRKIKYSDQDIAADINVMIEAGVDTTATTLEFAVLLATIYPDIQDEVYSELKSVSGSFENFKLESSKLHLLPKLRAFIHETLRLFPPSPQSFLRKITKDINVAADGKEYILPKNSLVHLNIYAMNHNEKYWGLTEDQDVNEMNLSIWLDKETGNFIKHKSFTTFSISKRDCPGSSLAIRELLCVLGMLFLKYKFIGNEMGYKSAKDVKIKQAFNMTMDPECGIFAERRQ